MSNPALMSVEAARVTLNLDINCRASEDAVLGLVQLRSLRPRTLDSRTMKTKRLAKWGPLWLLATACSLPTYFEDLEPPLLIWQRNRGLCGSGFALDGNGELWIDRGGCEDGRPELTSGGRGEAAKVEALWQAFESLPSDSGPDLDACGGNVDSFTKRNDAGSVTRHACASGHGSDLTGLQEPYANVATKFLALP